MRIRSDWIAALTLIISALVVSCAGNAQVAAKTPTLTPLETQGKVLFSAYCESCHSTIEEVVVVGPSLAGISQRASNRIEGMSSREYLEQSISDPSEFIVEGYKDQMPTALADELTDEERKALVAFLMTLR